VGAVTPSTNPAETLICNAIGMLAAGNAIYFSVHPGAKRVSRWVVSKMNELIYEACGIQNLIVTITEPSIEAAKELYLIQIS
ncbi:aldehyde dehydrogenase EutE, partial [Enterococcus sp. S181_ASV_20]|nr:aldehyde dehydrogenase EutE [Enterococcus sp. S181_ASV_20]